MKIVYLSTKISDSGGTAKITSLKANNFIEKWGFEVSIISTNDETETPFYSFDSRIKFYFLKSKMTNLFALIPFYKRVQKIINEINPNVVIVNDNGFKAYFSTLFLLGRPLWFEIHGSRAFLYKNKNNRVKNFFITWISDRLYTKFDRIILLNEESKTEWHHAVVDVIPNFIESTSELSMECDSKEIIAIGRVSAEKGYDRMLTIFEKISSDYPDWSLHIYGKYEDQLLLEGLLARNAKQVFFHGETSNISKNIRNSAFMIHTAYKEGMPMALLEVLNNGRTVVVFDVPFGINEIVRDQYNGFLIVDGNLAEFEEKIRLLIRDEKLRASLEDRAKKSLVDYQLEPILAKWKRLFDAL
ncbi:glycosyltransferase [Flavobacterium sp. HSC-61S13]|uniref:glycosyltransferase n=1 Tax=Flavobacterium sp. HSC-61S13 TaxID=2910963 RepID=UPI0020A0C4AF|nr:glycosyltransferase [Flavobacterium sp. HSC-61S13]MCP1997201.1 glycosyltransferase involved in cell wall biosynthesis [Flavobacterium sp. HSC-61S13]